MDLLSIRRMAARSFPAIGWLLAAAGLLSSLAACATDPPLPPAQCHAVGAKDLLGEQVSEQVIDKAIVSAGAMRSRVIRPGANITQELDPLRLNIEVDDAGRIRRMRCG